MTFKDPLTRLVAESVMIDKISNLNSKSEWRNNRVSRLVVETQERKNDLLKKRQKEERDARLLNEKIEDLEKRMNMKKDDNNIQATRKATRQVAIQLVPLDNEKMIHPHESKA